MAASLKPPRPKLQKTQGGEPWGNTILGNILCLSIKNKFHHLKIQVILGCCTTPDVYRFTLMRTDRMLLGHTLPGGGKTTIPCENTTMGKFFVTYPMMVTKKALHSSMVAWSQLSIASRILDAIRAAHAIFLKLSHERAHSDSGWVH